MLADHPRVSRPALPASLRKHGLCAVSLIGRLSAANHCSRTVFVSEIFRSGDSVHFCSLPAGNCLAAFTFLAAIQPRHLVLELGQLARAFEDFAIDDVGCVSTRCSRAPRLDVQHELRERTMQLGHRAAQEREARTGELGAGIEVEAQRRPSIDVVARL